MSHTMHVSYYACQVDRTVIRYLITHADRGIMYHNMARYPALLFAGLHYSLYSLIYHGRIKFKGNNSYERQILVWNKRKKNV